MGICDASLISSGSSSWVKLFSVLVSFSSLLEKTVFLTQHINYQACLLSHRVSFIQAILIVAEVAERGDFVHVAFEINDGRGRSILDDELDGSQRF